MGARDSSVVREENAASDPSASDPSDEAADGLAAQHRALTLSEDVDEAASGATAEPTPAGAGGEIGPLEPAPRTSDGDRSTADDESEAESDDSARPGTAPSIDADPAWEATFWRMIAEGDFAGAYWLARAAEGDGRVPPVASWLLAANVGGYALASDTDPVTVDLQRIATSHAPSEGHVEALLAVSAALRPALLAPATGLAAWLSSPVRLPNLQQVLGTVGRFASLNHPLQQSDLIGYESREEVQRHIRAVVEDLERWGERAGLRRTPFSGATEVWERLVSREIRPLIRRIREEGPHALEEVQARLADWASTEWIHGRIDALNAELHGARKPRIVGRPREQIVRWMGEASGLVRKWIGLVGGAAGGERSGWLEQQIGQLRRTVQAKSTDVRAEIEAAVANAEPARAAALRACARAFEDLRGLIGLAEVSERPSHFDVSLDAILGRRLHLLPEIELNDDGSPAEGHLSAVEAALLDPSLAARSVEEVIETWIERTDHRFVESLLERLDDPAAREHWANLAAERRDRERVELRREVEKALVRIEQAVVDGVIEEERRSDYQAEVTFDLESVADFSRRRRRLAEICAEIDRRRGESLKNHRERWDKYRRQLAETQHAPAEIDRLKERVEEALAQNDVRLADELLAHVEEVLDGKPIHKPLLAREHENAILESYLDEIQRIEQILGATGRRFTSIFRSDVPAGKPPVPEWASLPKNRKREAQEAIEAWDALKRIRAKGRDVEKHVLTILGYLGFLLEEQPIKDKRIGDDWALFHVAMSASNLSPVPQFGSGHSGPFHVLCVWERPGADTLVSRLREERLGTDAAIVFYLGRLTAHQRRNMLRGIQRNEMVVATLDEILLVYLARERDTRLPAFFACTLPYTGINPYTPFGDVPREMFFGREELARELARPDGSCIVYGGRQLGKSALLRHVQRIVHNPAEGKYALFLDINLIGEPHSGLTPECLWHRIRDGLKEIGVLPRKISTDRKDEIQRHIREWLDNGEGRRLIVLLDEADHFLNADARSAFQEVTALRALMMQTKRRFKVVFAGLHNVQRFQGLPNQPLAHFGRAICVGPLEPRAAWDLIVKPLHVLGFRFADPSASVLRILSYTNYHPGLIQLFCQELLKRLRETHAHATPPHVVEASVVEAGYNRELREQIRERFEWTLALDPRYQAVAWSMIVEQNGEKSYARSFSAQEIIRLVRSWTSTLFDSVESSELRGLLDEMIGLGVLVRTAEGSYRLRSPNLVRMLGRETQILDRLAELGTKGVAAPFDADSYHRQLKDGWSPFTSAQERLLVDPRYGTVLVFASQALGVDRIPQALRQLFDSTEELRFRLIDLGTLENLSQLRRAQADLGKEYARALAYARMPVDPRLQVELVRAGNEWAQRHARARSDWARLVLVFEPDAALAWLRLPEADRERLEDRASAVLWPRRWSRDGLWQTFERLQMVHPEPAAKLALEITGGWPWLVEEMLRRNANRDDPRAALQEMKRAFESRDAALAGALAARLGVSDPVVRRVFLTIHRYGPLEEDEIDPEVIDGDEPVEPGDCAAALELLRRLDLLVTERGQIAAEPVAAGVLG